MRITLFVCLADVWSAGLNASGSPLTESNWPQFAAGRPRSEHQYQSADRWRARRMSRGKRRFPVTAGHRQSSWGDNVFSPHDQFGQVEPGKKGIVLRGRTKGARVPSTKWKVLLPGFNLRKVRWEHVVHQVNLPGPFTSRILTPPRPRGRWRARLCVHRE